MERDNKDLLRGAIGDVYRDRKCGSCAVFLANQRYNNTGEGSCKAVESNVIISGTGVPRINHDAMEANCKKYRKIHVDEMEEVEEDVPFYLTKVDYFISVIDALSISSRDESIDEENQLSKQALIDFKEEFDRRFAEDGIYRKKLSPEDIDWAEDNVHFTIEGHGYEHEDEDIIHAEIIRIIKPDGTAFYRVALVSDKYNNVGRLYQSNPYSDYDNFESAHELECGGYKEQLFSRSMNNGNGRYGPNSIYKMTPDAVEELFRSLDTMI